MPDEIVEIRVAGHVRLRAALFVAAQALLPLVGDGHQLHSPAAIAVLLLTERP